MAGAGERRQDVRHLAGANGCARNSRCGLDARSAARDIRGTTDAHDAAQNVSQPAPRAEPDPREPRPPRLRAIAEPLLLVAVPVCMAVLLAAGISQTALIMLAVVVLTLVLFFAGYEADRPALRQIMPTVVLAALAAAGRILFAPIPDFKPVSAIAIIAGATLGRRNGFIVGSLAALTSNFFFGQGMWTPWQMYAWGLVGYLGGVLGDASAFTRSDGSPRRLALIACGLGSGVVYGIIINAYDIIGFLHPITVAGAIARVASALPFDLTHAVATALFLSVLYVPWTRRINRVVRKFALRS